MGRRFLAYWFWVVLLLLPILFKPLLQTYILNLKHKVELGNEGMEKLNFLGLYDNMWNITLKIFQSFSPPVLHSLQTTQYEPDVNKSYYIVGTT